MNSLRSFPLASGPSMKPFLLPGALAVLLAAQGAAAQISPQALRSHVEVLSSDAFEGRAPATAGEARTVGYLVEAFKAAGLKPGGDRLPGGGRAWTQDVPLASFEIQGPVSASIETDGGAAHALRQGEEIAIRAAQTGADHVTLKDAPLVFVGYGVYAPERRWDDFKGVDLKGKVALVLVNDPDFETGQGEFGGRAMTYYGRWMYKYEEAARRGAAGVLVIHETAPAAYGWATVKNSNTNAVFDIIRDDPAKAHVPVEGWIQRDLAAALFKAAGQDYEIQKARARTRDFTPTELSGLAFSTDFAVKATKVVSRNVAAIAPGSARPDEVVIYTAHWDHLGVGEPDAKGDRIYNGAVDNGTGLAVLLEIAREFAKAPPTRRSVLFLSTTAEEKGLLGAEYYAAHPLYPLATTVADLNMDAMKPSGPARDFATAGDVGLTLQDDLIALGKARGRRFSPDPRPEAGSFFRSDHFPFAKRGVPAISFAGGQDLVAGGETAGKAYSTAYVANRYHQPADEIGPDWNFDGIAQDGDLLYELGRGLAASDRWPGWKDGAEFKAARDQTAASRK